jgi:hypothetical protein
MTSTYGIVEYAMCIVEDQRSPLLVVKMFPLLSQILIFDDILVDGRECDVLRVVGISFTGITKATDPIDRAHIASQPFLVLRPVFLDKESDYDPTDASFQTSLINKMIYKSRPKLVVQ